MHERGRHAANRDRGSLGKKVRHAAAALAAVAGVNIAIPGPSEQLADIYASQRSPSAKEAMIGQAVSALYGEQLHVRCADVSGFFRWDPKRAGISYPVLGDMPKITRIDPRACDMLNTLAAQQEPVVNNDKRIGTLAVSVFTAGHEGAHLDKEIGTPNESAASCYAIQYIDDLTVLMGSTETVGRQLQQAMPPLMSYQSAAYQPDANCRPGGTYDISAGNPADFPHIPR